MRNIAEVAVYPPINGLRNEATLMKVSGAIHTGCCNVVSYEDSR